MKRIFFLILFISTLLAGSCCNRTSISRTDELRDSLLVEYMSYAGLFYDSSFLDWNSFTNLAINQNKADWGLEVENLIHPTWRGHEAASIYWDRLQSAKICLHCKSLPLRTIATDRMLKEMDALEEAFDEAVLTMVTQEYYLRVFQDVFEETFAPKVDGMTVTLARLRSK